MDRARVLPLLSGLLLGLPAWAGAQIYVGADAGGATVLSNFRSVEAPQVLIAAPVAAPAPGGIPPALPTGAARFQPVIREVASEAELSPQLLHAVIAVESGFDHRAVSPKGALGLMQLMPATARRFGVLDPFDPRQNVAGGAAYLKWLLQKFDGDLVLALAAYNAGEGAVVRAGYRIPPYQETLAYVPRVLARLRDRSLADY